MYVAQPPHGERPALVEPHVVGLESVDMGRGMQAGQKKLFDPRQNKMVTVDTQPSLQGGGGKKQHAHQHRDHLHAHKEPHDAHTARAPEGLHGEEGPGGEAGSPVDDAGRPDAGAERRKERKAAAQQEKARKARELAERKEAARRAREAQEEEERKVQEAAAWVRREARAKERAERGPRTKGVLYRYAESGEIVNADVTEEELAARAEARERRRLQAEQARAEEAARRKDKAKRREAAKVAGGGKAQQQPQQPQQQGGNHSRPSSAEPPVPSPPAAPVPPPATNAWEKPLLESPFLASIVAQAKAAEDARRALQAQEEAEEEEPQGPAEAKRERKKKGGAPRGGEQQGEAPVEEGGKGAKGRKKPGEKRAKGAGKDRQQEAEPKAPAGEEGADLGLASKLLSPKGEMKWVGPLGARGEDTHEGHAMAMPAPLDDALARFGGLDDHGEKPPPDRLIGGLGVKAAPGSGAGGWEPALRPSERVSPMGWSASWGPHEAAFGVIPSQAQAQGGAEQPPAKGPATGGEATTATQGAAPGVEYPQINMTSWFSPLRMTSAQPSPLLMQPGAASW
jgi:hypothetical protein